MRFQGSSVRFACCELLDVSRAAQMTPLWWREATPSRAPRTTTPSRSAGRHWLRRLWPAVSTTPTSRFSCKCQRMHPPARSLTVRLQPDAQTPPLLRWLTHCRPDKLWVFGGRTAATGAQVNRIEYIEDGSQTLQDGLSSVLASLRLPQNISAMAATTVPGARCFLSLCRRSKARSR
jgi:hypothetical protein